MNFANFAKQFAQVNEERLTTVKSTTKLEQCAPEDGGLKFRIYNNGKMFFTEELKSFLGLGTVNNLDAFLSRDWGTWRKIEGAPSFVFISTVPMDAPKPTLNFKDEAAGVSTGMKNILDMIVVHYNLSGEGRGKSNLGHYYLDFEIKETDVIEQPIIYVPKEVVRGPAKGTLQAESRKGAKVYPIYMIDPATYNNADEEADDIVTTVSNGVVREMNITTGETIISKVEDVVTPAVQVQEVNTKEETPAVQQTVGNKIGNDLYI